MAHLKSSGPYGFNLSFYQSYWHIVRDEVISVVQNFLNGGLFDSCINFTYIVFIPKIKDHVNASNFRPISLCNVIYKLVSKVLANCLKKILHVIISKNQSVFLPSQVITDNKIIAYKALHSIKTRQKDQKGSIVIKLNISKAYDKWNGVFLKS